MDNKLPLISVILPVYNVEKVLRRSVDSVLAQTYGNIEVILVDDGSPDRCPKICDEYAQKDARVRVIHQKNAGLSCARNRGIDAASGEYIAFVDSDDYVAADYLFFMYNLMSEHNADIVSCGAVDVYPSGKTAFHGGDSRVHIMDSREALERMCYNDSFFVTAWDKLYRKSLFDSVRFPAGKLFEDTGTTYKLVDRAERIVACCEVKYYYVISSDSSSITTSGFNMSKLDYVEMADEMADFIIEKYPDLKPAAERKQLHACLSILTQLVNSNTRNRQVEDRLLKKINLLKKGAMKNPRTPGRDKAALAALGFGFGFFALMWRAYLKIKKG